MNTSTRKHYLFLILTYLNFRPPFWRRVYLVDLVTKTEYLKGDSSLGPSGQLQVGVKNYDPS